MCGGDFNEFLLDHEKSGGCKSEIQPAEILGGFHVQGGGYGFGIQWPQVYLKRDKKWAACGGSAR